MTDSRAFEDQRTFLTGLAYRMLGSVADAEDMVQETFLRWRQAGEPVLDNPRGWFATTCTRLSLDRLRSLQRLREDYPGEWLPEPLVATETPDAALEVDESLSMALLLTIERLKPKERAAFLLHDVFRYSFDETADILDLTSAHCRQLAVRARAHLRTGGPRLTVDRQEIARLTESFFAAIQTGDDSALRSTLAEDVVLRADGGGNAAAAPRPVVGAPKVARFLLGVLRRKNSDTALDLHPRTFNGAPGVCILEGGQVVSAFHFAVDGNRFRGIYIVRNPDKLGVFEG